MGNPGRDPFGEPVRAVKPPVELAKLLGEVGAWGVNLHDNDLVPIDATPSERDKIVKDFKAACASAGLVVPMATVNLFTAPVFRDGAFTANDPAVRAYAVQKTMRAMDLGAELGAKIFVLWGGARGHGDGCVPQAGRSGEAAARRDRLPLRIFARQEIRIPVRDGSETQRAARRHLHGDDRKLSGIDSDIIWD